MEFLENVGYTILGGGIAAISGLVVQWLYSRWERKNAIKKIQGLLKPEFEELYQILIDERRIAKKATHSSENDFELLSGHEMKISEYLTEVGGGRLRSLAWDAVISSGNLIKLDNNEIEIIQSAHHNVMEYNKNMNRRQKDAESQMEKEFNENMPNTILYPDMGILEDYLKDYLRTVNDAIDGFKELDELPWFDHDKIKSAKNGRW